MKKKPLVLRIMAAAAALFLIVLLVSSLFDIYGNPFTKMQLKDEFQTYMDTKLDWEKEAFTCGDVSYSGKIDVYFVACEYKTQPRLSFSIERTKDGEMFDTYDFDIEDGTNLLAGLSADIYRDLVDRYGAGIPLLDRCTIRVDEPLRELDEQTQDALRKDQNVFDLPIYSIYYYGVTPSAQYEQGDFVRQELSKLREAIAKTDFEPVSYGASFFDESGNQGYEIKGVRKDVLEMDTFAAMVEELKEEPQKYKDTYGFERIEFEQKEQ